MPAAGGWGRCAGAAVLALALGLGLMLVRLWWFGPDSTPVYWSRQAWVVADDTRWPPGPDAPWRAVRLPDLQRLLPADGSAPWPARWFKLEVPEGAEAVYLMYLHGGGDVFQEGQLIHHVAQADAERRVRWERPQLVVLPVRPAGMSQPPLYVRLPGSTFGSSQAMPPVAFGARDELQRTHDLRLFRVRGVPQITAALCVVLAVALGWLGWRRPQEPMYALLGLAAALWGLRGLTFVVEEASPQVWNLWRMVYHLSTAGFICAMAAFTLRWSGVWSRTAAWGLLAFWFSGLLARVLAEASDAWLGRVWSLGLMAIGAAIVALAVLAAVRQRTASSYLMLTALAVALAAGVHDYSLAQGLGWLAAGFPDWAEQRQFLLHHAAHLLLLVLAAHLATRLADSLDDQEAVNAGLSARVAERTVALQRARDDAERASLAKTRFLAAAAHDLRMPMHTISLLLGVLRPHLHNEESRRLAQRMTLSVETLERLFGSLLDISKLDAGAVQARVETFPVQMLLDRLEQRLTWLAESRGLGLKFRPSRDWIRSSPELLERCLSNLLSNALRYTERGRVLVACRARGDVLAIQVWDTGPGIALHEQQRVFEEFVRLPGAGDGHQGGLGLGLAIVRRTADLLQHPLGLRSQPGRGSCFEIGVPRLAGAGTTNTTPAQAPVSHESSLQRRLQDQFVVLVDDDPSNLAALEALCIRWGCLVLTADSAEAALSAVSHELRVPDLLVTDLHLGCGVDGLGLVAALRAQVESAVPALLVTAETDPELPARAHQAGVSLLTKPASPERLLKAMARLLPPVAPGDTPVSD